MSILSFSVASAAMLRIATFYRSYPHSTPITPLACYGNKNNGVIVAAAGDTLWNNGAVFGKMVIVKCTGAQNAVPPYPCTGNSVIVKIVHHCPGCPSTIHLSKEAFSRIANPVAGKINIAYRQL